jgi:hypothetical protein
LKLIFGGNGAHLASETLCPSKKRT